MEPLGFLKETLLCRIKYLIAGADRGVGMEPRSLLKK
jgi:hypothetical protein